MHIVHWASEYGNFSEAVNHPDGLAVLAILIEVIFISQMMLITSGLKVTVLLLIQVEKRDNTAFRHIEHFDQILHPDGSPVSVLPSPVALEDLLPDNLFNYFRYSGSL